MLRTQLCKLIENHPQFEHSKQAYENPQSLRFGNLVMKNVLVVVIIIMSIGVYWKQRHQKNPMRVTGNFNVITLKQTVFFLILISFDNTCMSYVISWDNFFGISDDVVFVLEMLRVILVENIFFKFCVPLYFLIESKKKVPNLWADRDHRQLDFFMTAYALRPRKDLENQTKCVHQLSNQSRTTKSSASRVTYIRNFSVNIEIDFPDVHL